MNSEDAINEDLKMLQHQLKKGVIIDQQQNQEY